jgi:N-acetylglutamate synthase-like GNAT family acetyltransferase
MPTIPINTQIAQILNSYSDLSVKYDYRSIRDSPIKHHYLATKDGIVVGVVGVHRFNMHLSEIKHLVVPPNLRRHGLARRLVEIALKDTATPLAMSSVREENVASLSLLTSMGFKVAEKYVSKEGRSILILLKNLSQHEQVNETTGKLQK